MQTAVDTSCRHLLDACPGGVKVKFHPSLMEIGAEVARDELRLARAAAMADYLASGDHGDARLLGFRCRRDNRLELVLFEIRAELPQDRKVDIRRWEPIALAFFADNRHQPTVLAARQDFPDTPHQNAMPVGFMRSPCVDDRPWAEAMSSWTPLSCIERIRWWLGAAAQGALSDLAQAVDPVFVASGPAIVVPRERLQPNALAGNMTLLRAAASGPAKLFLLRSETVGCRAASGSMVVVPVRLPPQPMRAVGAAPKNLLELIDALQERGHHLLTTLRQAVQENLTLSPQDLGLVTVLVVAPLMREPDHPVVAEDAMAFGISIGLDELGVCLGVLYKNPDYDPNNKANCSQYGRLLTPSPPAGLEGVLIETLPVHLEFDRELASQCAGSSGVDDRRVTLVGAGAIGSHIAMSLAREGRFRWTIIDDDLLLPHNLARHTLNRAELGKAKAEALAEGVAMVLGSRVDACGIVGNVVFPGDQAPMLGAALSEADIIIDASASVAVARNLSDVPGDARRVSVFLNPAGTASIMLAEDAGRSIRLDALEAQYYRLILREGVLREHLASPDDGLRYTGACRHVTNRIPASSVAALSGLVSRGLSASLGRDEARITIWSMNNEGAVAVSTADPRPVLRTPIADWTIFYDEGLLGDIRVARKRALPAETGGALVGIVDVNRKVILVVDALSPPADSVESHAEFVRGIDGLTDHLQEVCAITRDQVRYVGEWHTHPSCHRATPSSTDLAQLEFLRAQLGREGIPPVMIIMGEQEEAVVSAFRPDQSKNPEA